MCSADENLDLIGWGLTLFFRLVVRTTCLVDVLSNPSGWELPSIYSLVRLMFVADEPLDLAKFDLVFILLWGYTFSAGGWCWVMINFIWFQFWYSEMLRLALPFVPCDHRFVYGPLGFYHGTGLRSEKSQDKMDWTTEGLDAEMREVTDCCLWHARPFNNSSHRDGAIYKQDWSDFLMDMNDRNESKYFSNSLSIFLEHCNTKLLIDLTFTKILKIHITIYSVFFDLIRLEFNYDWPLWLLWKTTLY